MKFNVSRLLETAKYLPTKVGQEIPDFFNYMADFVENTVRCLRGGLTFADNIACDVRTVSLTHGATQVVNSVKPVVGVIPLRVISTTYGLESFAWYYDQGGRLTVKANFSFTAPVTAPTSPLDVVLVLLF